MRRIRPVLFASLLLALACASDPKRAGPADGTSPPPPRASEARPEVLMQTPDEPGLAFTVEPADPSAPAAPARPPAASAAPLSASELGRLLGRLEPLEAGDDDVAAFRLRKASRPAPKPGETIEASFPPPTSRDAPPTASGPMDVLRMQPEGDVHTVPRVSVTFDQPMVPISGVADVDAKDRPVSLSPEPPGQWRWVGTQTLVFEPKGRMPMATEYTVSVAAGVTSATGGTLQEPARFVFRTPAPQVVRAFPTGDQVDVRPVIGLVFDQSVDPKAVLPLVSAKAGRAKVSLRLATAEEVANDPRARAVRAPKEERTVFLAPEAPLAVDAAIRVRVAKGVPSAEGPRTSEAPYDHRFRTYPKLVLEKVECGWGGKCRPLQPWRLRFSNALDVERLSLEQITVRPEVPGLRMDTWGDTVTLSGLTSGQTTYEVTVAADVTDEFGQTLGEAVTREVKVGDAEPALMSQGGSMVVLDPAGPRALSVHLVNYTKLEVRIWKVAPGDWPTFLAWQRQNKGARPPGAPVFDETVKTGAPQDSLHEFSVDLSKALEGDLGHAVVEIVPPTSLLTGWMKQRPPRIRQWVQSTQLAIDAFVDPHEALAWITRLADGRPVGGAEVTLAPAGVKQRSQGDGLARLAMPAADDHEHARLEARAGADVAFLPESEWSYGRSNWHVRTQSDETRWFTFDDRGLYKPGETVRVKGWLRTIEAGPKGDVVGPPEPGTVRYLVSGSRGNELAQGTARTSAFGGFDVEFELPDDVNLGGASIVFTTDRAGRHVHRFDVQEFRRPEYEVSAMASEGPHIVGDAPVFTVDARYFAGGGLVGAPVAWTISASPGHYAPPGHDDFTFGFARPWWWWSEPEDGRGLGPERFEGETDATGAHRVRVPLEGVRPARAQVLEANVTVTDVNRQAQSAKTRTVVHPAAVYVGLRASETFVGKGEPLVFEHLVVDLDGRAVPERPVTVAAERLVWERKGGRAYSQVVAERLECAAVSADAPGECTFAPKHPGQYRVRAEVTDEAGRPSVTELTAWVGGSESPPSRIVEEEPARLVPDQDTYAVGEVARVLVLAPFADAEGLLTLRRDGILRAERFTIDGASHVLQIPITEGHLPELSVHVELSGAAERGDAAEAAPKRPAHASGSISLRVPPVTRALTVVATPAQAGLPPGAETEVAIAVTGADGAPVASEVSLVVVDEAVLALSGYELQDPLTVFYTARRGNVHVRRLRSDVVLGRPDELAPEAEPDADGAALGGMKRKRGGGGPSPQGAPPAMMALEMSSAGGAGDAEPAPIAVRTDFSALAHFSPALRTGADGQAVVKVKLPDNLTRYRVMAVAVDAARRFGKGEAAITARLPLMVRPSPPRFLSFGDRFELPVVLQNQTDAAMTVQVGLRATNLALSGPAGWSAKVPAHDRVEVRFEAAAAKPGTARYQVAAAAGAATDAASASFPVYTPATTEAFATYGTVGGRDDATVAQPVARPADAVTAFGGLEISVASTQLQALTDAVVYLSDYPYECAEQRASRILALAALKDVLTAFAAPGLPEPAALERRTTEDLAELAQLQNGDGGWGFWRRGESYPFVSVHVAHALARAARAGFSGEGDALESALGYLRAIERRIPRDYPAATRRTIEAYALYVRALRGDLDGKRAQALLTEAGGLGEAPLELIGWLYPVFIDGNRKILPELRRTLGNRVVEEAGTAHFVTSYEEGAHLLLHSDRRVDGLLLEGLLQDEPDSDLVPKLARGLLAHKTKGRWASTQENAWVLLALHRYFRTYEKITPDFVARAWLGEGFAGEHAFSGRTTETHLVRVPMADVPAAEAPLVLQKDGAGRLYYRIGLKYAPQDLSLDPLERGFSVTRAYAAVDDPADVQRDDDGTWRVKAGARVKVTLQMVAPTRRYHVALVDKLPAGFEPLNPALKTTEALPPTAKDAARQGPFWWWYRPWFDHENLRDERVEAFSTLVWAGVHEYTYYARATTPGTFVAPPTKAEEMYSPEVFGRSGTAKVVVE